MSEGLLIKNREYVKPIMQYWTAQQLDRIEARMSSRPGSGSSPLQRFIDLIRYATAYNNISYENAGILAENIIYTLKQIIEAEGYMFGNTILSQGYDLWEELDYRAKLFQWQIDTLSLNVAVHNYNINIQKSQHDYEYAYNQDSGGWAGNFVYGMPLKELYKLKLFPENVASYNMSYNGCEIIACYNVLLYLYKYRQTNRFYVYENITELIYYFERHGSILYGKYGTFISNVASYLDSALKEQIGTNWSADLFVNGSASDYDSLFLDSKIGILSFFWPAGQADFVIHTIMIYKRQIGGVEVIKTYNYDVNDGAYDYSSNSRYCFASIYDLVSRGNLTPVSFIRITSPEGAL